MQWTAARLQETLAELRQRGGDRSEIEVKRAAGGTPNLTETLCAFSNMPDGGTIILGVDEGTRFGITGVSRLAELEAGIAGQARTSVDPPAQVSFEYARVDGRDVLITTVAALGRPYRPCVTVKGRRAYLRQADGDYRMSEQEVAQMLALRDRPRYDNLPVPGSSVDDLSTDLVTRFLIEARSSSRRLGNETDEQVLRDKGVLSITDPGRLTVAGLYALGRYPQSFAPSLSITAAVELPDRTHGRTRDLVHLDGPIPDMLDEAMEWVARNTRRVVRYGPDGHGLDQAEIPMIAVRELIANALVHRDLGPHTQSRRVEIRLRDDYLVISNPGGLWGVSKDQLGTPNGKSAVNEFLYDICKFTRTVEGSRVIEGEGGGIREARLVLRKAGLRPPEFHDSGVGFTAQVSRHALLSDEDLTWLGNIASDAPLSDMQREILASMRSGRQWTNSLVREEFAPIDSREALAVLQGLVSAGLAESVGDRGSTTYRLAPELADDSARTVPAVEVITDRTAADTSPPAPSRSDTVRSKHEPTILAALDAGPAEGMPRRAIVDVTGLTDSQVAYALRRMEEAGRVVVDGGRGIRTTRYRRPTADGPR
ncbi:MAG: ATP-binding protein [Gordonia sp. (in: high G+C Gram-positive bacteria)]|uniref:ATP-binding protein n=1 Tax=Gordonia sp. (in: high G+C Gram-positive bacteria) TaxID=84139 RepID=UPI0039E47FF0